MVSSSRMAWIGMVWLTGMSVLAIMTVFGGMIIHTLFNVVLNTFKGMGITTLPLPLESISWIEPAYYFIILCFAIAITIRCYQETISVTDYFPDTGVF